MYGTGSGLSSCIIYMLFQWSVEVQLLNCLTPPCGRDIVQIGRWLHEWLHIFRKKWLFKYVKSSL